MKKINKKKKVAIFDIDGTIFRSSLLIEITEALIREGIFPKETKKIYAQSFKNWSDRKGSYEKYIGDVVKAFEDKIIGVKHKDYEKVAKEVINVAKQHVYRYTRDLVKKLKKRGYFLLAISHSPEETVRAFCKHLGFDKTYGRIYEVDEKGKMSGQTLYLDFISDKSKILKRAVFKENLTLKDSVGVGDSETDVKFLKMVDNPICFNPNNSLYREAKKSGWKVVVERKDVVYELN